MLSYYWLLSLGFHLEVAEEPGEGAPTIHAPSSQLKIADR